MLEALLGSTLGTNLLSGLGSLASSAWSFGQSQNASQHQMDFQRDMTYLQNQLYRQNRFEGPQQMVEGYKAAGLNPMLTAMGNMQGAQMPSGGSGASAQMAPPQLIQALGTAAQLREVDARIRNIDADTANKQAENPNILATGEQINATVHNLRAQANAAIARASLDDAETAKVFQVIDNLKQELENARLDGFRITEEAVTTMLRGKLYRAEIERSKVERVLRELDANEAVNRAIAQESAYMRHIAPYTGELGKLIHSAAEASEAFRRGRMPTGREETINQGRDRWGKWTTIQRR